MFKNNTLDILYLPNIYAPTFKCNLYTKLSMTSAVRATITDQSQPLIPRQGRVLKSKHKLNEFYISLRFKLHFPASLQHNQNDFYRSNLHAHGSLLSVVLKDVVIYF